MLLYWDTFTFSEWDAFTWVEWDAFAFTQRFFVVTAAGVYVPGRTAASVYVVGAKAG